MEKASVITKKREANVELLRIVAMLMVTLIHCIDNGQILKIANNISIYNYILVIFLRVCAGIANGLFIIISGYFQINNKFNLKKILNLWGKTLFYSLSIYAILSLFNYKTFLFQSVFPVSIGIYWFISAYIALYFITPILNIMLNKLNKNQFKFLVIIFIIMFAVLSIIFISETFMGILFSILMYYMIGAYIRKYVEIVPKQKYFIKYIMVAIIFTCIYLIMNAILNIIPLNIFSQVLNTIYGKFMHFSNLLMVIMTVLLFMKFKTINIKSNKMNKFITFLAPSALSVYIIQENIHFRSLWQFDGVTNYSNSPLMIPYMFLLIISVFIICLIIDLIRRGIMYLLKKIPIITKLISNINKKIDNITTRINNYIS